MSSPLLNTPMLRQYQEIKEQYQDAILFFRLGDFYEMFLDDAICASKELSLTLTGRGKDENRVAMCGVPHHASESYISKLVEKGYKVAICEQIEEASESKGITKRDVVKVITPATIQTQQSLKSDENNYLCAFYENTKKRSYGLSFVDISTGEFHHFHSEELRDIQQLLDQIDPKELLLETDSPLRTDSLTTYVSFRSPEEAEKDILSFYTIHSISAFGLDDMKDTLPSISSILNYLTQTQKNSLPQLTSCKPYTLHNKLQLDKGTIQNLELTQCVQTSSKKGSLFWVLDYTKTALGARKLSQSLKAPSLSLKTINDRLDAVSYLKDDLLTREELREVLSCVYDIERLVSRLVSGHENPRDLIALKESLIAIQDMKSILDHTDNSTLLVQFKTYFTLFNTKDAPFQDLIALIENSIVDTPPTTIKDGQVIKDGYSKELDDLKLSFKNIKEWIGNLENVEREKTGIKSLKVGFNKVFGYYIQISNATKQDIPEHYIRKQTLTSAERYITPELKEKEIILLNGEDQQKNLEKDIYLSIIHRINQDISILQELSQHIASLDFLQSLATAAQKLNYCRPTLVESDLPFLELVQGRHPVLEKNTTLTVIPNTVTLSQQQPFILITGPNMAGKSTLMKQIALSVIMAQIGSFVPAESFIFSLVDKLFTRIGALDNLYHGQSTFMVEMLETATILHNATSSSLILLDEIGRGTSTYDGLSIAGSVCDYIMTHIKARTLFATHYHELTHLESTFSTLANYSMTIHEENGKLAFGYTLKQGPADKSYGIHVAEMAGLPKEVIQKATRSLRAYEQHAQPSQLRLF